MTEKRNRLAPKAEVLRELYLKSGNNCFYPGCNERIFNSEGNFVAQICHIEAAELGGQRFNSEQTNEECRAFSNLMLMCYPHHIETNKVDIYPVDSMKEIKDKHEKKFTNVIESMLASIKDHTKDQQFVLPANLLRFYATMKWDANDTDEIAENLTALSKEIESFSRVPQRARQLFTIVLDRAGPGGFGGLLCTQVREVQEVTHLSDRDLRELFSILDNHSLVDDNGMDDMGAPTVAITNMHLDWNFWADLKKFSREAQIPLRNFTEDLDFSALDEP